MNDRDFDKFIKQSLENFSAEVPDDMWQKIKERRKRRILPFFSKWYILASMFLVTFVVSYYYITQNVGKNLVNKTAETNNNSISKTNKKNGIEKDSVTSISDFLSNDMVLAEAGNNNKDIVAFVEKSDKKITTQYLMKDTNANTNSALTKNILINYGIADTAKNNSSQSHTENSTNKNEHKDEISLTQAAIANPLTSLESKTIKTPLYSKDPEETKEIIESPKNYLTLEVYVSPEIPSFKVLRNENYSNLHKSVSKSNLSYLFGTRISGPLGKHFFWKTGFQFEQINEGFNYTDANNNIYSAKNKYNNFNIPLIIGYQKNFNNFTLAASGGVLVNVHAKNSGEMVNAVPEVVNIGSGNIYKTNPGSSLYFGGMVSIPFKKNTEIFAEPHYRLQISNMATNPQPFMQKINAFGLNIGMHINLFKTPPIKE